jgi:hypothetical protein
MPKTRREQAETLLSKADIDLRTAEVCLSHGEDADPVCFHVQQTAEKLLKAALPMVEKYSDGSGMKRGAGGYARAGPARSGWSRARRLGRGSGDPPHVGQGVTLFCEPQ